MLSNTIRNTGLPLSSTTLSIIPYNDWMISAYLHRQKMDNGLLYPQIPNKDLITRSHSISENPIYNFLHYYYRYSSLELKLYSPGMNFALESLPSSSSILLIHKHMREIPNSNFIYLRPTSKLLQSKRYGFAPISRYHDIIQNTLNRNPHYGCFGLHEWAMLYSNRRLPSFSDNSERHQSQLKLRVDQHTIDATVEASQLTCTHFDAWRFFDPAAQPMNHIHPLTRSGQIDNEQPGCIHATMDIFRYAYELYPYVSSDLLRACLSIALEARKIDMCASPYDVSAIEGCGDAICIETLEGKMLYVQKQQELYEKSNPLRAELLQVYKQYLKYLVACDGE